MAPHPDDPRDGRGLEIATQPGASHERAIEGLFVRRHVGGRREDDRIGPVVDRVDAEHRLGSLAGCVVAGPFAKGSFDLALVRIDPALHHDLGIRGDRKPGDGALHDAIRGAADAAGPVVLGRAVRDLGAGREEEERIAPGAEGQRHLLLAREPLVAMLATVLAR